MIDRIVAFLKEIGLKVEAGECFFSEFSPGSRVWISDGGIVYEPFQAHPGDFLHEAGHLAVLPSYARPYAHEDVDESTAMVIDAYLESHQSGFITWPEDPLARASLQCSDCEAISWSYAAAHHLGIDTCLPFAKGFENPEEARSIHLGHQMGCAPGIHGLRAAGFIKSTTEFPYLKRWIAP